MKKILSILSAVGISASAASLSSNVVSCSNDSNDSSKTYTGTCGTSKDVYNDFLKDFANKYDSSLSYVGYYSSLDVNTLTSFNASTYTDFSSLINDFGDHPSADVDSNSDTYEYGMVLAILSKTGDVNSTISHVTKYDIVEKYGDKIGNITSNDTDTSFSITLKILNNIFK